MANISKIKLPNNQEYDIKDSRAAWSVTLNSDEAVSNNNNIDLGTIKLIANDETLELVISKRITDLTGYTWTAKEDPNDLNISLYKRYNLNYKAREEDHFYDSFEIYYPAYGENERIFGVYLVEGLGFLIDLFKINMSTGKREYYTLNDDLRVIHITGGTDATNPELIAWFQENGTLIKS